MLARQSFSKSVRWTIDQRRRHAPILLLELAEDLARELAVPRCRIVQLRLEVSSWRERFFGTTRIRVDGTVTYLPIGGTP